MALIEGVKVPVPADGRVYDGGVVYQVKPAGEGERWPHKKRIGKIPQDSTKSIWTKVELTKTNYSHQSLLALACIC